MSHEESKRNTCLLDTAQIVTFQNSYNLLFSGDQDTQNESDIPFRWLEHQTHLVISRKMSSCQLPPMRRPQHQAAQAQHTFSKTLAEDGNFNCNQLINIINSVTSHNLFGNIVKPVNNSLGKKKQIWLITKKLQTMRQSVWHMTISQNHPSHKRHFQLQNHPSF